MRLTLLVLLVGFLACCKKEKPIPKPVEEIEQETKVVPVTFRILGDLQEIVTHPKEPDLEKYFEEIHGRSLKACVFPKARDAFSSALWSKYAHPLPQLIAGCYTFFTMNDMNAHHSFEWVRRNYPGTFNCHSVAFTQLYMMHSIIGCKTLTAIDINWRILWGHYQFAKGFANRELHLERIKAEPGKPTGIWTFCYRPNYQDCMSAYQNAMDKYSMLDRIELQLSFLHDMEISNDQEHILIYVSNAIDPGYTSSEQFKYFVDSLLNQLKHFQRGIVVYHAGGSSQFSVYEIVKQLSGDPIIKTVCRDDLVWAPYYSTRGRRFKTYFDHISKTETPNICSVSLAQ